jgi:hypothetical protein
VGQGGEGSGTNGKRRRLTAETQRTQRRVCGPITRRVARSADWYDQYPLPPCFWVRDVAKGLRGEAIAMPCKFSRGEVDVVKGVMGSGQRLERGRQADSVAIREKGVPGKGSESDKTWRCTPGFLRKSAQPVGRTRDRCDTENERVRKCLKTRRDECEELVTRASEQRGEEEHGGVRTDR